MEDYGAPCDYCDNYNELRDALNLIDALEETVQSTWDGVREMLEEIAEAFSVPLVGSGGALTNGELVKAVVRKAGETPQNVTVAESADALYHALHHVVGDSTRCWSTEILIEEKSEILNAALDAYEKAKGASEQV